MEKTFEERKTLVHDERCTNAIILEAFPHLKSFEGLMVMTALVLLPSFSFFLFCYCLLHNYNQMVITRHFVI